MLVYLIWSSGRHAPIWFKCGRWRCLNCGPAKLQEIAINVADKTMAEEFLYQHTAPSNQAEAVRKSLRRKELSSLRIRFHTGGIFVLTDKPFGGREWQSNQVPRIDAIASIVESVEAEQIQRRDFTGYWKLEDEPRADHEKPIFRINASSITNLRQLLASIGEDLESEFFINPVQVAERLADLSPDESID